MKIYGLTGKTGAGKSTVAEKLSALGFYVIDGDKIARSITEKVNPQFPCWQTSLAVI